MMSGGRSSVTGRSRTIARDDEADVDATALPILLDNSAIIDPFASDTVSGGRTFESSRARHKCNSFVDFRQSGYLLGRVLGPRQLTKVLHGRQW